MKKHSKLLKYLLFLLFSVIVMFLSFNRHSKSGVFNYHSEIWADKAGYYIYLPAVFNYNFNAASFPDSIAAKTGDGFRIDTINNKVITKYSCGVAILQLPFFLTANIVAISRQSDTPGFTKTHHVAINVAAVIYLLLGLFFLGQYLKKRFQSNIVWIVLFTLFAGTNLYYYSVDETGMSHVYSFFLFSLFLFLVQKTEYFKKSRIAELLLSGIVAGLIVLIRPTNLIFLAFVLFLEIKDTTMLKARMRAVFRLKTILWLTIGFVFINIPQAAYLHYTYGSPFHYAYENETFVWTNPQLLKTWFSPNNGLFLYTPFFVIILISLAYSTIKKSADGRLLVLLFFVISYVFSSWWIWNFGCSFGARSYVEYLAVFSIPLVFLFLKINSSGLVVKIVFYLMVLSFIVMNFLMTYSWDGCYYGIGDWDWDAWIGTVMSKLR
ncbi:MAG: hypothetical protein RB294_04415 [Bacteroidales bacterium]|jgi:hypothetical protein|nr:hypothetical protein [Bacteroidales bacterium]